MNHRSTRLHCFNRWLFTAAVFWLALVVPLQAAGLRYLPDGKPDTVALLAPPPRPGSAEQAADLAATVFARNTGTTNDLAIAEAERTLTVFAFTPAIGPSFQRGKLPRTEAFFRRVHKETDVVVNRGKNFWKRQRPYELEPSLLSRPPEKDFSYPSGHSTVGTVYALLLAELFPEKCDAILAVGRDIGWHRVQLGLHYPADVHAGRALAQAIVRELKANPDFQRDFAEAKAEVQAAQQAR